MLRNSGKKRSVARMGRKCAVPDCQSEEGRIEDRGVTFHKIPHHSDIRPKWMSLCHIPEDKFAVKVVHVCSRHFLKVDFCGFKGKKYMLRQGALPSVFPWSKLKKVVLKQEPLSTGPSSSTTKAELPQSNIQIQLLSETEIKQEVKEEMDENVQLLPVQVITEPTSTIDETINAVIENSVEKSISTTIEQKGKAIQTAAGELTFAINTRLEALDFNQMWFPAKIIEIDYEENEVLIHFEKYSSKYDEWISMNSSRLRPLQPAPKKTSFETFIVGEKCLATWSDMKKFPATVTKIIDKETYEVRFNDGLMKVVKGYKMAKAHGKIGSSPLFEPVQGTKQERRDKKRKLIVADLFRKKHRADVSDDSITSPSSASQGVDESTTSLSTSVTSTTANEELEPWRTKWENGRPIGIESTIETNDGLKPSVVVNDPRLPPNWQKHLLQRSAGQMVGKWDTILLSPEGRKFRTRADIKTYLDERPELNYKEVVFDFSLHKRPKAVRRSIEPVVKSEPAEVPPPPEVNPNSLKIPWVDDAFRCPIEGCGKSFRRENLAQMHVKHYHPEYTKFLDSTPNVADLAYARTVGESLDKSPDRTNKSSLLRQSLKSATPKIAPARSSTATTNSPQIEAESKPAPQVVETPPNKSPKHKDSEILKLLNSKPNGDDSPKYPPGLPPNMYPDIKLKDLLNKSEGVPKREETNIRNITVGTSRPHGIKTLLPVIRQNEIKKEIDEDYKDPDCLLPKTSTPFKQNSYKSGGKRRKVMSENADIKINETIETVIANLKEESVVNVEQLPQPSNYIVEGGEVIKIVRMKREEIINCTCGITEEDGLMIQCELCLCWQHAYCNNIERENQVPAKYICYICQNPIRQRSSKKYFHDQDWLKNGTLPVANYHCKDEDALKRRFDKLKKSHDLSGRLLELRDYMHSLKVKLKIAESKNHQKLYLWSKPWEKSTLPEKVDSKQEMKEEQSSKSEVDLLIKTEPPSEAILFTPKEEQKLKEDLSVLNHFIDNNLESMPLAIVPQPEAAIEPDNCKINLLEHIVHSQNLVEERLNDIETQIDLIDGESNTEEDFNHTCQTVQMLLRDLNVLKELSQSNSL